MQCCGSMPCDPSNQTHDCCKGMVSAQSPNVLPVSHVTLHAPVMVVTDVLASPQRDAVHSNFALRIRGSAAFATRAVHAPRFPPDLIRF